MNQKKKYCCCLCSCYCGCLWRPISYQNVPSLARLSFSETEGKDEQQIAFYNHLYHGYTRRVSEQNNRNGLFLNPPCRCCQIQTFKSDRGVRGWCCFGKKMLLLHAIIVTSGGWGRWEAGWLAGGAGLGSGRRGRKGESCHAWLRSWLTVGPLCFTYLLTACLVVFQGENRSPRRLHQKIFLALPALSLPACHMMAPPSMVTPRCPALCPCDWD